ncbi:hypothetical protein V6N12_030628 [Hibiscus sabdariffa]|uniref:Uncharacterized protein n=1 Tax=Hibiscus sabdariffa TaxID=183260 RepID=A0ABR2A7Z4_9ROSI
MTGGKIASVLVKQILGIICLILLCNLVSEPVGVGAFNPVPCLGNCSEFPDCNQACIKKGFPKGEASRQPVDGHQIESRTASFMVVWTAAWPRRWEQIEKATSVDDWLSIWLSAGR